MKLTLDQLVEIAYARKGLISHVPGAIEAAEKIRQYAEHGQNTLFGESVPSNDPILIAPEEIPAKLTEKRKRSIVLEMLREEREMIGVCMTADPLSMYEDALKSFRARPIAEVLLSELGSEAATGGYVTDIQRLTTKKGKPFLRFKIEDSTGIARCVMWSEECRRFESFFHENTAMAIRCRVDQYGEETQLVVWKAKPLDSFAPEKTDAKQD